MPPFARRASLAAVRLISAPTLANPSAPKKQLHGVDRARAILRNNAMNFAVADEDSSMSFGYHEFRGMLPKTLLEYPEEEIKAWFDAMDYDDEGKVSVHEWFLVSLRQASMIAGCSMADLFTGFDENGSGKLDHAEFNAAVETMGFGAIARQLFDSFDTDHGGTITVSEVPPACERRTQALISFAVATAPRAAFGTRARRFPCADLFGQRHQDIRQGGHPTLHRGDAHANRLARFGDGAGVRAQPRVFGAGVGCGRDVSHVAAARTDCADAAGGGDGAGGRAA